SLTAAILFAVAAASTSWANPADPVNPLKNRFLIGKGLDICDQGAFFVGGVPKVYECPAGSNIVNGTMIRHGDPGDPDPAETNPPSEGHGNYPPAFPIPPMDSSIDANIQARVGAIGPAPNPANNAYLALNYYKQVVPNFEALLPSSNCATCVPTTVAPDSTWDRRAMADLVEGLGGAIVSPHSQSGIHLLHMIRVLKE